MICRGTNIEDGSADTVRLSCDNTLSCIPPCPEVH